jgi:hypothetical protein
VLCCAVLCCVVQLCLLSGGDAGGEWNIWSGACSKSGSLITILVKRGLISLYDYYRFGDKFDIYYHYQ